MPEFESGADYLDYLRRMSSQGGRAGSIRWEDGIPYGHFDPGFGSGSSGRSYSQGGMFGLGGQYGTGQRQGMPDSGQVGTPDVGTASELLRFQRQGGQLPPGMQPEIYTMRSGSSPAQLHAQLYPEGTPTTGMMRMSSGGPVMPVGGGGSPIRPGGFFGGQPGQTRISPYKQQQPFNIEGFRGDGGGLEQSLERSIQQLLQGGSGYTGEQEQLMRTRAGDYAAGQQAINEQRMREDAIRRGASTSAGGDADIRSELNRVSAQGAMGQQQATQDIDRMLADLRRQNVMGGLSAGGGLFGQQLGERQSMRGLEQRERESLRELEMLLASLQSEQGNPGLQFIMGGRR